MDVSLSEPSGNIWEHLQSGLKLTFAVCLYSTVRIWDYTQDACINVLSGHKAPVRGLLWNTEVPYLLISGKETTSGIWITWSRVPGVVTPLQGVPPTRSVSPTDAEYCTCDLKVLGIIQSECGTPEMEPVWTLSMTMELMSTVGHMRPRYRSVDGPS